jgi:hypothetical protein
LKKNYFGNKLIFKSLLSCQAQKMPSTAKKILRRHIFFRGGELVRAMQFDSGVNAAKPKFHRIPTNPHLKFQPVANPAQILRSQTPSGLVEKITNYELRIGLAPIPCRFFVRRRGARRQCEGFLRILRS